MYGKLQISGKIRVKTGMHIGGADTISAIGAVDSPVFRDTYSDLPMIPGSSLKGKMRSLLAREFNEEVAKTADDDHEKITRLFGCSKENEVHSSRLLFSDMVLANADELHAIGLQSMTEIKAENFIDRVTAVANPRQIERVIRNSLFDLDLIYEIRQQSEEEIRQDFETIAEGMKLLQYDYLGGSGSRGYGKVQFENLEVKSVIGRADEQLLQDCGELLRTAVKQ